MHTVHRVEHKNLNFDLRVCRIFPVNTYILLYYYKSKQTKKPQSTI